MRFTATILIIAATSLPAFAADDDAVAIMNCVIFPDEQVELGSPVPGVIEFIGVQRSDRVTKGQAIARLESSVEKATLTLAHARASTDTEIELRRVELSYDAQHRDRLNALQLRQAVSSQNMDDAERVTEAAGLRVRLAQDKRREAVLDERRAAAMLARKSIVSPIDGVVIQINNRVGEYVETRPIARIARLDPLRVEVIAPLALFGTVHQGMKVAVGPETDPDNERIATVSAVDAVADPGSGTFGIELELPNPNLELPAGIKCSARLLPGRPAQADAALAGPVERAANSAATHNALPASANADRGEASHSARPELQEVAVSPAQAPAVCVASLAATSEERAQRIAEDARRLGATPQIDELQTPHVFGYLVATPVESSRARQAALAEQLRFAGVTDQAPIGHGEYAGRISLGVYNGPRSAERRRVALSQIGFDSDVLPRTRVERSWRVSLRLPAQAWPDEALTELRQVAGENLVLGESCTPARAASR